MKSLNQTINFENFNEFTLTDSEMIFVRGGDGEGHGDVIIPPEPEPEL
ncbi:MAG: hypothetical protein K8R35_09100 [Bacteroidales bacterium]|nr:hypothetical protein [Bacteroidales bacterium]